MFPYNVLTLRPLVATGFSSWTERVRRFGPLRSPLPRLRERWSALPSRHRAAYTMGIAALCLSSVTRLGGMGRSRRGIEGTRVLPTTSSARIAFEENRGQADAEVRFLSRAGHLEVLVSAGELVMRSDGRAPIRLRLEHALAGAAIVATKSLPEIDTYQRSALDEAATRLATYESVEYRGVYPGVDLRLFLQPETLRLQFEIARGASAAPIGLSSGREPLVRDGAGWRLGNSGLQIAAASAGYQHCHEGMREIPAVLALRDGRRLTFEPAAYDVRSPLVLELSIRGTTDVP